VPRKEPDGVLCSTGVVYSKSNHAPVSFTSTNSGERPSQMDGNMVVLKTHTQTAHIILIIF
jgi:hypothetical protein